MAKQIKELFDKELDHLKIDNSFVKTLRELRLEFMNRNDDHLSFFTGNLVGVHQIRYRKTDREAWFDLVLETDEDDLKPLVKEVDYIDNSWIRANDVVNLSSIWLLHAIFNSKLSARKKEEAMFEVCLLLHYKFLSSLMINYFEYRAVKEVAMATYEALSRKFAIKAEGSWQGLLEKRSRDIISSNSIHYKTIANMDSDGAVVDMISDIQDRMRNVVKKLKATFDRVRKDNLKISSTSTVVLFDGEKEILAQTRDQTAYTRYLKDIISDKPTFIRTELVDIVNDSLHTMNPNYFMETLEYCSDNYGKRGDKNIEKLIELTLLHVYRFLSDNEGTMSSGGDIANLLQKLKNLYLASRMSDDQLLEMKSTADKIVNKSIRSNNSAAKASVRSGLQLYIVLRAFSKKYYQS